MWLAPPALFQPPSSNGNTPFLHFPSRLLLHSLNHSSLTLPCPSLKKHDFPAFPHPSSPITPSELGIPVSRQPSSAEPQASDDSDRTDAQPQPNSYESLSQFIEDTNLPQLALYGGLIAGGLYLLESILNSFESFPLLPEIMQFIGVLYAILISGQIFQGKQLSLTPSPVKSIIELVENKETTITGTDLELPQGLDERIVAIMTQLRRERDDAVSQVEELRQRVIDYARVIAEKEALESVAIQLAQERDQAMTEVVALKQAVDAMSDRMQAVEGKLQQELEPLKQNSQALENVALQLASERDVALKKLSDLKAELTQCTENGNLSLELLASKSTDKAVSENNQSVKVLDDLQTPFSAEQEKFLKNRIDSTGLQFIDIRKPYEEQKEDVEEFVSYLADKYGAPSGWTTDYLKQLLASQSESMLEVSSAFLEHGTDDA